MAKRQNGRSKKPSPQLVVRLPPDMNEDLREAARGLGMDVSDLVRMMLKLNLPSYLKQARDARDRMAELRSSQPVVTPTLSHGVVNPDQSPASEEGARPSRVPPLPADDAQQHPHARPGLQM
jgi:hypothetical protein